MPGPHVPTPCVDADGWHLQHELSLRGQSHVERAARQSPGLHAHAHLAARLRSVQPIAFWAGGHAVPDDERWRELDARRHDRADARGLSASVWAARSPDALSADP